MKYIILLAIILAGCSTQCYLVAGKCKPFTPDDIQGATTLGYSNENR